MKSIMFTAIFSLVASVSMASDRFETDITCNGTIPSLGGVDILIQSNPTAWVKRAAIVAYGFSGPYEEASFQIPLNQPTVSTVGFFDSTRIAYYEVDGFKLEMAVSDGEGKKALGSGTATVVIEAGADPVQFELTCKTVR